MNNDIMVSIICNTYNHELYIKDALESFVNQKTNFKFEVLVHDDASTDKTADIIREYEEKYPEIIKPIYQTENQHSKPGGNIRNRQLDRAEGKYIALCEGDDYWTDENKLQRQVDFLENNPEYSLCVHSAIYVKADTKEVVSTYKKIDHDIDLTPGDVILDDGEKMATNSMLFVAQLYRDYAKAGWKFPVGDYPLAMYLAFNGKVRCLHYIMSAYRVQARGSWSQHIMSDNISANKRRIAVLKKLIKGLNTVDEYTGYKYHKYMQQKNIRMLYEISQKAKKCNEYHLFKDEFEAITKKQKIMYYIYVLQKNGKRKISYLKRSLKKLYGRH